MTRSHSTIPFHKLQFNDDLPSLRHIEDRLKRFLKQSRRQAQEQAIDEGRTSEDDCLYDYDLVQSADMRRVKRRADKLLERKHSTTGMYHLTDQEKTRLTPLRDGFPISRIVTEHEADEIAAALHGPVTLSCRSDCSFMQPLLRRPRGFSSRVLNASVVGCRSH